MPYGLPAYKDDEQADSKPVSERLLPSQLSRPISSIPGWAPERLK